MILVNMRDESGQSGRTVYSLIFTLLVNVVEISQHLESGDMGSGIVDDSLRPMLDEVFQQLKGL
jgi:hypothetical protein